MKIKELHLINFGKFSNKRIRLEDKLNIIYGENEAGKSTIFHFIVGMFYGFYKPYVKNRRLLDIHETYHPWNGEGYCGSLLFNDESTNRNLRLERNFVQGQESVKVYVESTGEDITGDYDIHPIYRLPDVAAKHLGVSYATFINTLAIKQLGHETDENLDREIKDTVVNALSTYNMDVSVNKVQDRLTKELNTIGSSRRKSSAYSLKKEKITSLENELIRSKDIHEELLESQNISQLLDFERKVALDKLVKIKEIENYQLLKDKKQRVELGERIHQTIINLKKEQKELNISDEFSVQEIEKAIEDHRLLDFTKEQIDQKNKTSIELNNESLEIKNTLVAPQTTKNDEDLSQLTKSIYACSASIDDNYRLREDIKGLNNEQSIIKSKLEELKIKGKQGQKTNTISILLTVITFIVISLSGIWLNQNISMMIRAFLALTIVFIGLFLVITGRQKLNNLKGEHQGFIREMEVIKANIDLKEKRLAQNNNQVFDLLNQYEVEDLPSLTSLKDQWLKDLMTQTSISQIYENHLLDLEKIQSKFMDVSKNLEELKIKETCLENQLRPITSYYYVNDSIGLKKVKERLVNYFALANTIEHEERRLKDCLKDETLEGVQEELAKLEEMTLSHHDLDSDENKELLSSKSIIEESIHDIDQQLAGIKSKSQALSRGHRRISEVEEELIKEKESLKDLDLKKKAFELIAETINGITLELQHNFAPLLNESVSSMVKTITANKYEDIKINPQMLMRLKDPMSHHMINARQLSRGTLDLFYLALRDALATWVNGDKELPVLLDETFANFDDSRLSAALELFSHSERQVLLFTCQKREVDLVLNNESVTIIKL